MSERKSRLVEIVKAQALTHLPQPVQLASGDWSSDFVDAKRALANGKDLALACRALLELAEDNGVTFGAVGGMTLGADQFSHGIAVLVGCDWFVVRKAPKGRGTNQRVEGTALGPGRRVLVIDDVVTRGTSLLDACAVVREAGAEIAAAMALVDRGEVARPLFDADSIPYYSLFTYHDLGIEPVGESPTPA